jgi:hypothetical protein
MKYIWPEVEGAGAKEPKVCLDWASMLALVSRLALTDCCCHVNWANCGLLLSVDWALTDCCWLLPPLRPDPNLFTRATGAPEIEEVAAVEFPQGSGQVRHQRHVYWTVMVAFTRTFNRARSHVSF